MSAAATQSPAAPGGRPRALDDTKCREICALVTAGCGIEGAARYIGCAPNTIRRQAHRDPQFNNELRQALLAAELNPLNALRRAATTHWRAAAWLLERTNPQRFARQNNSATNSADRLMVFTRRMFGIINDEIRDPPTRIRMLQRLNELLRHLDREYGAPLDYSIPKPCRQPDENREPAAPDHGHPQT